MGGGPTQPSLISFAKDGTVMVADLPVTSDQNGLGYSSAGLGVWESTDQGGFSFTFGEFLADAQGDPSNLTVDGSGTADTDAGTLSGSFVVTITGPGGETLAQFPGTLTGNAMAVEPMPAANASMAPAASEAPAG